MATEFCYRCQRVTDSKREQSAGYTKWTCAVCGWIVDEDFDDAPLMDEDRCPWCGGEGIDDYMNCPEAWGEDCPSEVNHLITCPKCKGSGLAKDCDVL